MIMHGSGPRANRPHQVSKTAGEIRRKALEYQQTVRVEFVDGKRTKADLDDAERWVKSAEHRRVLYTTDPS
jgi:hypothetical protein